MKKKIIILIIEILIATALTFLVWPINLIESMWSRAFLKVLINIALGISAFIAAKLSDMKIDFEWKNWKQYLIGILICLALSLVIAWIPALTGNSLVGNHTDFSVPEFIFSFFDYLLIVGPAEEMLFRIYLQKTFVSFFRKQRWAGVLIAALLFGLWHLINGSLIQVAFTFAIGCVFGFSEEYIKDLHYPGISLCHGLYDFLNYIVRLLVA